MTTYYVAVDIGCIECGESSNVLGIFDDESSAQKACDEASDIQAKNWHGQHNFEVFRVDKDD
jgi:hypothetical protein